MLSRNRTGVNGNVPLKKPKKRCLWLLCQLLLGWLVLFILQQTLAPWPKPIPGVRLEPSRPFLADADVKPDNAYFYIRQMGNFSSGSTNTKALFEERERWAANGPAGAPYPAMDEELTLAANNIELARNAANTPNCQVTTIHSLNDYAKGVSGACNTARHLAYRAESAVIHGDWKSATADFRINLLLGNHVARGGGITDRLIGTVIHRNTTDAIRRCALEQTPPPEFFREMQAALDETARTLEPAEETLRHEWLLLRETTDTDIAIPMSSGIRMIGGGPDPECGVGTRALLLAYRCGLLIPLGSSPWQTRRHFDAVGTHVIAASAAGDCRFDIMTLIQGPRKYVPLCFINDPVGRYLTGISLRGMPYTITRIVQEKAELQGTQIALAIRQYQLQHDGTPPAALADLVPSCVSTLPADPFSGSGEPFHYRTDGKGWTLYSVYKNGVDDGGLYNVNRADDRLQHKDKLDIIYSSNEFARRRADYAERHKDDTGK